MPGRLFLFILFIPFTLVSQVNIVPNAGFESTLCCPNNGAAWPCATSWNNVNMTTGIGLWGTPDFFHSCGTNNTAPPATFSGTCTTHGGSGMMGMVFYNQGYANYREYLASPLTCTMQPGFTYTVSFWITNGTGIKSPWTIRNIGIHFSNGPLAQTGFSVINVVPQCEVTSQVSSTVWTQYTFTISPAASWNYLTFGCFRPDANNNVTLSFPNPGGPASAYANYFVDDISVIAPPSTTTNITFAVSQPTSCNGVFSATASSSNPSVTPGYTWLPGNQTGSVVSGLTAGSYTLLSNYLSGCVPVSSVIPFSINNPAPMSLTVSASSPTACTGNTSLLFASSITGGIGPPYIYNWTGGPATQTYNITHTVSGTFLYTLTVADALNCNATGTVSITYFNPPALTVSPGSFTVCPLESTTLTASGASAYTWLPSATTGSSLVQNPSAFQIYTVNGTAANGCTATATASVFIKPAPLLSFNTHSINCASLGEATVNASGGIGPYSFTWTPTAQTTQTATGMFPGVYTVNVHDQGTGCVYSPTVYFAPLVPLTGTVSSTGSVACFGLQSGTAAIALSGGSGSQSYTWSSAGGSQSAPTATLLTGGVHTVSVTDALTFCQVTHTFSIYQPPQLTLNISASAPSVCLGSGISFTSSGSGGIPGYTYTWSAGPQTSTHSVAETSAGSYTYSVNAHDANNCPFLGAITVDFVPNPIVTAASSSMCPLTSASLSAAGASTYTWSSGQSGNTITVSPFVTSQYTVTGSLLGCNSTAVGTVVVLPVPVANIQSNAPVCMNDTLKLSADAGALWQWTGPAGFSSSSQNPFIASSGTNHTGWYYLKITGLNSCTNSSTAWLVVHPTPQLSAWAGTVCEGQPLNLGAGSNFGISYAWSGPAGFTSALQNPQIVQSQTLHGGVYGVSVTSAAGCTNAISVTASVAAMPEVTLSAGSPVCTGSSLTLSVNGNYGYKWYGPEGFFSTSQNNILHFVTAGGIYTLTTTQGPCIKNDTITVVVNPLPVPVILHNSSPVCENGNVLVKAGGGVSYSWIGPSGFSSSLADITVGPLTMEHKGIYTVAVTDAKGCVNSTTAAVNVLANPVATVKGATVCIGSSATLQAQGGISWQWTGPGGFSSSGQQVIIPVVNASNSGNYMVNVSGSNSCVITVMTNLSAENWPMPVPVITAPKKVCLNTDIHLQGSGGTSYIWSGPMNFTSAQQSPTVSGSLINAGGVYTLSVRNESNCIATTTAAVGVYPLPKASVTTSSNNLCVPFCTGLSYVQQQGSSEIKQVEFSISKSHFVDSVVRYCFNEAGNYVVSGIFRDSNNCVSGATLQISAYPKPEADYEYFPQIPIAGIDEVKFYNSSAGKEQIDWQWHIGAQMNDTLWGRNQTHQFKETGSYPVTLVVRNSWGCSDTIIKTIIVEDEFTLYVPDAFTPNGDGINEFFQAKGMGIKEYFLEVFNRWGQRIFSTTDFNEAWDGRHLGEECKSEVYVWRIAVVTVTGLRKTYNGHVALVRGRQPEEE